MRMLKAKVQFEQNDEGEPLAPIDPCKIPCVIVGSAPINGNPKIVQVTYTSFMNSMNPKSGGATFFPQEGDYIIITTLENAGETEYYYVSTIVSQDVDPETALPNLPKGSASFATGNMQRRTMGITDHFGGSLEFVEENEDGDSVSRRSFVALRNGSGSEMVMSRRPDTAGIVLQTADEETVIKMSDKTNSTASKGQSSIAMRAKTHFTTKATTGANTMEVGGEGTRLNLKNRARADLLDGLVTDITKGDINIESLHNTVNLIAKGFFPDDRPGIFLESSPLHKNSVIQLKAGGKIQLIADDLTAQIGTNPDTGKIEIIATKGIDIYTAAGDINISAPAGKVNLQPTSPPVVTPVLRNELLIPTP